jgi:hypothetical protein
VAKYLVRGRPPPTQRCKTFLRTHAAGIAAMDLLVVPTIGIRFLYAFVILHHDRRRILSVAVTSHPTAEWVARQIVKAFRWQETPQYLLRDRDGVYGLVVRQRGSPQWVSAIGPSRPGRLGKTDMSNASSRMPALLKRQTRT